MGEQGRSYKQKTRITEIGTPSQEVDALLGATSYDEWRDLDREADVQIKRYERMRRQLAGRLPRRLFDMAESDFYTLGDISSSYRDGINRAGSKLKVNKERVFQAHDLCEEALTIATNSNDLIEGVFGAELAASLVIVPFMLLQYRATVMLKALNLLLEELKGAEREVRNQRNKRAFHLAVSYFEAMFPEISLASRAVIYLTDVAVDRALAPDDSPKFTQYAGDVVPGVKQFSEAVHHIHEYGHTAREVAELTGKIATVTTFYFDFKEIYEGEERVEKLEKLVEKVKDAHDEVVQTITNNLPVINRFLMDFERILRNINDSALVNADLRDNLLADVSIYKYKFRAASVSWLTSPYIAAG